MLEKIEELLGSKGKPWTARRRCRAAIFRRPASMRRSPTLEARLSRSSTRAMARRLARLYGTRARRCSARATVVCRSRPAFRRRSLRGRGALSDRARMGGDRRGRAVAPHQARPALSARARPAALEEYMSDGRRPAQRSRRIDGDCAMPGRRRNAGTEERNEDGGRRGSYPRRVADASSTARSTCCSGRRSPARPA